MVSGKVYLGWSWLGRSLAHCRWAIDIAVESQFASSTFGVEQFNISIPLGNLSSPKQALIKSFQNRSGDHACGYSDLQLADGPPLRAKRLPARNHLTNGVLLPPRSGSPAGTRSPVLLCSSHCTLPRPRWPTIAWPAAIFPRWHSTCLRTLAQDGDIQLTQEPWAHSRFSRKKKLARPGLSPNQLL